MRSIYRNIWEKNSATFGNIMTFAKTPTCRDNESSCSKNVGLIPSLTVETRRREGGVYARDGHAWPIYTPRHFYTVEKCDETQRPREVWMNFLKYQQNTGGIYFKPSWKMLQRNHRRSQAQKHPDSNWIQSSHTISWVSSKPPLSKLVRKVYSHKTSCKKCAR